MTAPYYVYLLECSDGTFYTGIATDVDRRFAEHAAGTGSKYVHAHGANRIRYSERCADKRAALRREIEIKKLSRMQKIALIGSN